MLHENLGREDIAESLFPGYPLFGPDRDVLNKEPIDKRATHRSTFKMLVADMAADYYDLALEYFHKFRRNPYCGDPIKEFKDVVDFFSGNDGGERTVRDFLAHRERTRNPNGMSRMTSEAVMRILAIWLCIPDLNMSTNVPIEPATCCAATEISLAPIHTDNYLTPLRKLIERALPQPVKWDGPGNSTRHRRHLYDKRLNGGALRDVAQLEIVWTRDITEHLKLENRTLKLFRTAGFCYYSNYCSSLSKETQDLVPGSSSSTRSPRYPAGTKFPPGFTQEISSTFQLLFGLTPWSRRVLYNALIKDKILQKYTRGPGDIGEIWTCSWSGSLKPRKNYFSEDFPYFGPRLLELEDILKEATPNSLSELFRDSRNAFQFYTFKTGVAVLVLAFVALILQVIQAVAAWVQVAKM